MNDWSLSAENVMSQAVPIAAPSPAAMCAASFRQPTPFWIQMFLTNAPAFVYT